MANSGVHSLRLGRVVTIGKLLLLVAVGMALAL
jgi:hypothetical protein